MSLLWKRCEACTNGRVVVNGHDCPLCSGTGTVRLTVEDDLRAENERLKNIVDSYRRQLPSMSMTKRVGIQFKDIQAKLEKAKGAGLILRRYHGGDGTVTREKVIDALGVLLKELGDE